MEENELLAQAIGWQKDQIETVNGETFIVIGDERHRFDLNDPLVIDPIREKYGVLELPVTGGGCYASLPGRPLVYGATVADAIARAVIAAEGLA